MSLPHALCLVSLLSRSFSLVLSLAITLAFHSFSPRPSVSVSISASVLIISDVINLSFSPFVSLFLSRSSLLPRYLPFSNIARPAGQFGAPVDPDPVFARSLNWGIPTKLDEHSHRSDVGLMYTDARGASSELLGCVVTSRPQSGVGAGGQHALEAAAAVRPPPPFAPKRISSGASPCSSLGCTASRGSGRRAAGGASASAARSPLGTAASPAGTGSRPEPRVTGGGGSVGEAL